jgi:PAS domain S-box-containing protein
MQTGTRKSWLYAAGLLATTLIMLTLVGAALRGSWQDHRSAQLDRLAALSRAFTAHVGGVLHSVADDLRLVAGEIAADPTLLDRADPRLARRLALMRSARDRGVRYAVATSDDPAIVGDTTFADRGGIDSLIATHVTGNPGELQVSPPLRRAGMAETRFALSTAILHADGRMLGIVMAHLAPADLMSMFGDLNMLSGSRMSLFEVGGVLLARMPVQSVAAGAPIGRSKISELILEGARDGATIEKSPIDGSSVVSHFVVLDGLPIIPVITVPESAIWSSWVRGNIGPLGIYTLLLAALLAIHAVLLVRLRARERADETARDASTRSAEAAQQGLAVTEARFRDAIESIGEGFVLWDANDRLLLWNRRFEILTGIGDDIRRILRPGMRFEDAIRALGQRTMPGATAGALDGWLAERLQRRADVGLPWTFTAINGRHLELEERRTSEGGLVSIYRDVGDQMEALRRVAEAEARFREGVESMEDGFLLLDRDDRVMMWNRSYLEMVPYMEGIIRAEAPWTEMLDLSLARGLPELDAEGRARWIAERLAARTRGETTEFENHLGRILQATDRPTSDGGHVIILRDVTEEKRLLRRISESEARFRDGIESMADAFALWDRDDRLLSWNRAYAAIFPKAEAGLLRVGRRLDEIVSGNLAREFPDLDAAEHAAIVAKRSVRGADGDNRSELALPDGRIFEVSDRRTADGGWVSVYRDVTEHRRAGLRIEASEARFRDGIESMTDGFVLWDSGDRLVTWNRRLVEFFPEGELFLTPGLPFARFARFFAEPGAPPKTREEREEITRRRLERRARLNEPFEIGRVDGRIIRVLERRTSDGGTLGIYSDVTEERRSAALVAASEARFRDGIESMAEGLVMWDAQDRMALWNQRARDMFAFVSDHWRVGDDFEQAMTRVSAVLMPDAASAERARWVNARKEAHARGTTVEFTTPEGRVIEVRDRRMSDGGAISVYRDVSEERRLMRRLAESEARFWDGIDSMGEGFLLCDPQDRIFAWNHQAVVLAPEMQDVAAVGKPFSQFLRDLLRLLHPDLDASALDERFRERMEWRAQLGVARDLRWPSGRILRTIENRTSEGGIVSIWHDVTAQLRAQAELERALSAEREMNAQQRRFVSIASHEFRTPLAVIDGATQRLLAKLAEADGDANAETRKRLDRIRGAVSRMTELIERTLSSARLDDGRIEIETRVFDLAGLLREVGERQRQISPDFEITLDAAAGDLSVEGDVKLLEQVFTNLLSNAVKYSGRARRIEVSAAADDEAVQVRVSDHGIGIPADEMSQLFTRFFRARTAMGIPGTGIGLHLVRELVQMHGGRVDVASEPGKGSSFTVTLPRRQQMAAPTRTAAE